MAELFYKNKKKVEEKIQKLKEIGTKNLIFVSDFDRTLSKEYINGKRVPSIFAMFRHSGRFSEDFFSAGETLFQKYYPIENDSTLTAEQKTPFMEEWWDKQFGLIIGLKLTKQEVKNVIHDFPGVFRSATPLFLNFLEQHDIPLVVLSASEKTLISLAFQDFLGKNIPVVSNSFLFEGENIIGYKPPLIHTYNKNFHQIEDQVDKKYYAGKKGIIVMGDSLGDANMGNGGNFLSELKIGIHNALGNKESRNAFLERFDIVLEGHEVLVDVIEVVKQITQK